MPAKRASKSGSAAPVAPVPQVKSTAPPAPQVVRKNSADNRQPAGARKNSQTQVAKSAATPVPEITRRRSVAQEQLEILTILMDAGQDWKPRNKVVKKVQPKPTSKQSTRPMSAKPAPKTSAAPVAKAQAPAAKSAPSKRQSLTPSQQQEQQEILSVLMDAGKDWKPRNKVIRHVQPKKQANKSRPKQTPLQASPKAIATKPPTQAAKPNSAPGAKRNTPQIVKRKSVTVHIGETWPIEQQEILSVLMDAGADWKPRTKDPSQEFVYIQPKAKTHTLHTQPKKNSPPPNLVKTQPATHQKMPAQAIKHIHAAQSQPRAKLAI